MEGKSLKDSYDIVHFHVVLRCSGVLQHGKAGRTLTLCLVPVLFAASDTWPWQGVHGVSGGWVVQFQSPVTLFIHCCSQ